MPRFHYRARARARESDPLIGRPMNILDILSPKAIKVPLMATDKKGAIDELIDTLAAGGLITQADALKKVVWEREQQRTTGIGEGLAIPHGKAPSSKNLVVAIGRPNEPIDFGAIDNKPVRLIVLLASPPDKTSDHIQALGKISRLMADPKFRIAAYTAPSADAMYQLFEKAEKG
jgi:fructose-specific phosphotransferase system IIA component